MWIVWIVPFLLLVAIVHSYRCAMHEADQHPWENPPEERVLEDHLPVCLECQKLFTTMRGLKRHRQRVHKEDTCQAKNS